MEIGQEVFIDDNAVMGSSVGSKVGFCNNVSSSGGVCSGSKGTSNSAIGRAANDVGSCTDVSSSRAVCSGSNGTSNIEIGGAANVFLSATGPHCLIQGALLLESRHRL